MVLTYGLKCGFFGGNVQKLTEDLAVLQPTLFPSVPRLFNRIHSGLMAKFKEATGVKGWLVRKAIDAKMWYLKNQGLVTHSIYDKLVFG